MLLTTTTTYLITPHPLTWKARLYVAKSVLKHALVSLIESSSTSVSRARMSCIIRPSEGISDGSALFSSLARTWPGAEGGEGWAASYLSSTWHLTSVRRDVMWRPPPLPLPRHPRLGSDRHVRTKSCRLWQNLDTISSLKGMSCLTWLMYGYST